MAASQSTDDAVGWGASDKVDYCEVPHILAFASLLVNETRGAEPLGSAPLDASVLGPPAHSLPLKSATASSRPARRMRTSDRAMSCR